MIKREDKNENVERISKANEYKKAKIMEKIQFDNLKAQSVSREKEKLMETRFHVRKEAEKQKNQIMSVFENMKKKGKLDNSSLQKLGLDVEIKEENVDDNQAGGSDIELVKER